VCGDDDGDDDSDNDDDGIIDRRMVIILILSIDDGIGMVTVMMIVILDGEICGSIIDDGK
jgi:hypothetical protein